MKNEKLAVVSGVKEVSDLSRMSDDLSVGLASSIASVVSGPAVERGVNLAVQLAHVIFIEDGDVRSFLEAVLFVAHSLYPSNFKKWMSLMISIGSLLRLIMFPHSFAPFTLGSC